VAAVTEPSIEEIADFLQRLRWLTAAGRAADPEELAQFERDKQALLARIPPLPEQDPDL
jgi:hypothetical protein